MVGNTDNKLLCLPIFTVPEMFCPRPESQNGVIIVSWAFVHTGGLPLTNISVTYTFQQENIHVSVPGGISARSVTVPNLIAGEVYIFNIIAENTYGSSAVQCEGILHELGELCYIDQAECMCMI